MNGTGQVTQTIIAGKFIQRTVGLSVNRRSSGWQNSRAKSEKGRVRDHLARTRESTSHGVYPIGHRKRWGEVSMSKGMDRKKESRKKPAKTFDEKRAAKREKREAKRR